MNDIEVNNTLDACGLHCPEPMMLIYRRMRDINAEEVLKVLATDPSTLRDIPKYCHFIGHQLIDQQQCDEVYTFYIKKSSITAQGKCS